MRTFANSARTALAAAATLAGCAAPVPAPVDDRRPAVAVPAPKPPVAQSTPVPGAPAAHYTVKRGDTLYSIALEHGVDYRELAQWNELEDPGKIRVGQQLRLDAPQEPKPAAQPEAVAQVGEARTRSRVESRPLGAVSPPSSQPVPVDGSTKTSPKALRLPYSEQNVAMLAKGEQAPAAKPAPQTTPQATPQQVSTAPLRSETAAPRDPDAIEFVWPAKGRLLMGFAESNSKGVDIAGKAGDPVLAAAPGRVMYTGTGIRGYGKLIVIKHDNGFNSVYAHNREILVKEGQSVARGQRIAELGDTDADTPKLHFEIRKSGKPVDPMRYLPPS